MNTADEKNENKMVKAANDTKLEADAKTPVFVEAEKLLERMLDYTRETASRAFELFRERGGQFGRELDDWFMAERELLMPVPVQIRDDGKAFMVTAPVPGFKPEEIEVSIKDDRLYLSGKTEASEKKEEENIIRQEWSSNRFFRSVDLPRKTDPENVKATLKDGILQLTIPKAAEEGEKKIAVAAG
jgi:HSP20 family protein